MLQGRRRKPFDLVEHTSADASADALEKVAETSRPTPARGPAGQGSRIDFDGVAFREGGKLVAAAGDDDVAVLVPEREPDGHVALVVEDLLNNQE